MPSRLRSFWRALVRRPEVEREMAEEMRFHLDARIDDLVRSGLPRTEAGRRARIEFGGLEAYKEQCRESRGFHLLDDLRADLRYAARTLAKSRSFSLTAILTLALGIGLNTGLFTLVNTLLIRPIAVRDPYNLYQVLGYTTTRMVFGAFSIREFQELSAANTVFHEVIADSQVRARFQNVRLGGFLVSGNYFGALGVGTRLGRPVLPEDAAVSAPPVVVLSDTAWRHAFGGDPQIIGREVELSGSSFTVIGVAAAGFTGIDSLLPDFWAPISLIGLFTRSPGSASTDPEERSLRIIGRLRPGVTPDEAQSALTILLPRISEPRHKELQLANARLESRATYQSWKHADLANVIPLVTAFALVLLIACMNLSAVLLARALNRRREIGIRLSLGASRGRIVRQLITESALLSVCAGAVGLALSYWSWILIRSWIVSAFSMKSAMAIVEITPDYRVFAFAFVLSLVTGVLFGLTPALHATRPALAPVLKMEGSLLGSIVRRSRFRDGLVIVQFSLSLVLLIGAGLLLNSAMRFASVEPGFDVAHTLSVQTIQETASKDPLLPARLRERLKMMPGVLSAAHVMREPLRGSLPQGPVATGSGDPGNLTAGYNEVSSDYFATLGIPILRGRAFTDQEAASHAAVAVISEATAKRYWPAEDPIGRTIDIRTAQFSSGGRERFLNTSRTFQVVGVAKDVVSAWLWDGIDPTCVYLPAKASQLPYYSLLLRVNGRPPASLPAVRAVVNSVDPSVEFDVRTMDEVMDLQILPFRVASWGAAALGVLGLILASLGIYGVVTYTVSQRTREIAIRMALGADRRHLLWTSLGEGCRLIAIGVGCGLVLAFAFSRILGAMIFKVNTSDPLTFSLAPLILGIVGLLATYLPSRRATRVNPNVALKCE